MGLPTLVMKVNKLGRGKLVKGRMEMYKGKPLPLINSFKILTSN
jgi:hypothetical protein